jgi:hypothetical protein
LQCDQAQEPVDDLLVLLAHELPHRPAVDHEHPEPHRVQGQPVDRVALLPQVLVDEKTRFALKPVGRTPARARR